MGPGRGCWAAGGPFRHCGSGGGERRIAVRSGAEDEREVRMRRRHPLAVLRAAGSPALGKPPA